MSSSCNKSNFQGNKFFHIFCPLDTYFYLHKNWNTYYISNSSSDTALLTLLEDPLMQDYKIHHLDNKSHHMYCLMDMLVCQAMAHNHWKTYLKYIWIHFIKNPYILPMSYLQNSSSSQHKLPQFRSSGQLGFIDWQALKYN